MSRNPEKYVPNLTILLDKQFSSKNLSFLDFMGHSAVQQVALCLYVIGLLSRSDNHASIPVKVPSWATRSEIEVVIDGLERTDWLSKTDCDLILDKLPDDLSFTSPSTIRMRRKRARAEGVYAPETNVQAELSKKRMAERSNRAKTSHGDVSEKNSENGKPSHTTGISSPVISENPEHLITEYKDTEPSGGDQTLMRPSICDGRTASEVLSTAVVCDGTAGNPENSASGGVKADISKTSICDADKTGVSPENQSPAEMQLDITEEDKRSLETSSEREDDNGRPSPCDENGGNLEGGTKVIRKIPPYNPPLKNAGDDDSYQQLSHTEDICYQEDLTNTEGDYDMREETTPYSKAVVPRVNAQNGNERLSDNPSADDNGGDNGKERSSHSLATAGDEKAISPESTQHTAESTPVQSSRTKDEAIAESCCTEKSTPAEAEPAGRKRPDTGSGHSSSVLRQLSCPDPGASGNPEVRESEKARKGERYPEPLSEGYLPGFEPVIGNPRKESLLPPDKPEKGKRKRKGRREPLTEEESAFVNAWKKVYNELCWNLPRAIGNTTTREVYENLVARIEENSGDGCDAEAVIREVFRRANQSYLMRGVKTSYRASFGKLLDKRIFYNTCNGNYNDPGEEDHVHDSNEEVKAMLQREAAAREAKKGRYNGNAGNSGNNGTRFKSADEVMQECYGHLQDSDGTEEAASGSSGMTLAAYMEWKRNGFKGAAN